jgi:hypothetical protein
MVTVTFEDAHALWSAWSPMERRIVGEMVALLLVTHSIGLGAGGPLLNVYTDDPVAAERLVAQELCDQLSGKEEQEWATWKAIPARWVGLWPTERLQLTVAALLTGEAQDAARLHDWAWWGASAHMVPRESPTWAVE